jgi:hypothetical protein
MKRRDYLLIFFAVLILSIITILILQSPRKFNRLVTLSIITNSPSASTGEVMFHLKNNERYSIFLSKVFVDVKTPYGWLTTNEIVPRDPRGIDAGGAKDLLVSVPSGNEPWRLRAAYGNEAKGPELLLIKIDFVIHFHKIPYNGFGAFVGSNSVSSTEISK